MKKSQRVITIIVEYAWICLNKQGSKYASDYKHAKILNMAKFWIWQDSQYTSIIQPKRSEYARIFLDRIWTWYRFWIWQSYEYARVTQDS